MSVISAVITKTCTVHASDSFITQRLQTGEYQVKEKHRSKIIRVPQWRGAMAYWGLAKVDNHWSTVDWLEACANRGSSPSSAEQFANCLAGELERELSRLKLDRSINGGIGIHFSVRYDQPGCK